MKIKKIQVPYQPDYNEPTEVPYQSGYSIPVTSKRLPSKEDVNYLQNLVKEGRNQEAENFINKAVLPYEVEGLHPGISTRNYIANALHQSILNRNPYLDNYTPEGQSAHLPDIVYPGLKDLKEKLNLSNELEHLYSSSYTPIDSKVPNRKPGSIKLDTMSDSYLDDVLHEYAHSVDDIFNNAKKGKWKEGSTELKAIQNFVKNNPKLKKLYESPVKETTRREDTPLSASNIFDKQEYSPIRRVPNFQEYDPKTGDFGSDIIESPIDKYKEVGGEHHIERPFSLENFNNFNRGDLKDIVDTPAPSKFPKIKKLIG